MPNLGTTELIIILVVVILIFGLGKLPEVGRGLGQSIHDFRAALINDENEPET
jgi:sec-independent protein translocase protein TatA